MKDYRDHITGEIETRRAIPILQKAIEEQDKKLENFQKLKAQEIRVLLKSIAQIEGEIHELRGRIRLLGILSLIAIAAALIVSVMALIVSMGI